MASKVPIRPLGKKTIRVTALALLALLITSAVSIALTPLGVTALKDEAQRAEGMIEVAEKAEARVKALIEAVKKNDTIMNAINTKGLKETFEANVTVFGEGCKLLEKANDAFKAGSYGEAMQNATMAMEKFRDAFRGICAILQEAGILEIEVEGKLIVLGEAERRPEIQAQGLLVAMNRSLERIEALNIALVSLSYEGAKEIRAVLRNANLCLNITKARELLSEPGHVAEVAHNLTLANRLINQAHLMLKAKASEKLEERMERFRLRIEERIERMVGNLSERELNAIMGRMGFGNMGEFQKAMKELFDEARERYMKGSLGEAFGRLKLVERRIGEFSRLFEARQVSEGGVEEHPSLEVIVTKEVQKNFITLRVTVKNTGDVPITFPNAALGLIIERKVSNGNGEEGEWKPFYSPVSAQVLITLDPGEAREIAIRINKPPQGEYRAVAHGWSKLSMKPVIASSDEFRLP
jgi:hypothetical protein